MAPPAELGVRAELVEPIERVSDWHLANDGEAGVMPDPVYYRRRAAAGAEPGAAVRERRRHAVHHAEAVQDRREGAAVVGVFVGAVDLEHQIGPVIGERTADARNERPGVDGIVDDVERRDHVPAPGNPLHGVRDLEGDAVGDPCLHCSGACSLDLSWEDVEAGERRVRELLRKPDDGPPRAAPNVGPASALLEPLAYLR
jgi:hypothetical protein